MTEPTTAHKAWVAAAAAFLTSLVATLQGRTDLETMGAVDWLIVLLAAVLAGLTVYAVPNQVKGSRPRVDRDV